MDFDTKLREVLDGVNPLVNWSIAIPAIKQLIESKQPEKHPIWAKADFWDGWNDCNDAWREGMGL